jgi:hypothetical protein
MSNNHDARLPGFSAEASVTGFGNGHGAVWDGGVSTGMSIRLADNICSGGGGECHCFHHCYASSTGCHCQETVKKTGS